MTGVVEFDQADASVSPWMRNRYESSLGLTPNHKRYAVFRR